MKRSRWEGRTVVWRYGCPSWADIDGVAMDQLRLANRMWNDLVRLARDHDEARQGVEDTEEKKALRCAHRAACSAVTKRYYTDEGLYWGTAGDIANRFMAAEVAVIKARTRGEPAELHFRRFDGSGTLTVQFNDGPGGRDAARLVAGYLGVRFVHEGRHGTLTMRVRGVKQGDHSVTVPVVVHRPLPTEADVAVVRLTRRRIAGQHRLSVTFTCRMPSAAARTSGSAIAVKLHWDRVGEDVRVAEIASDEPLPPLPYDLAECVACDGHHAAVVLPSSWRQPLKRDDDIQAIRKDAVVALRPAIVSLLRADPGLAERARTSISAVSGSLQSPASLARILARVEGDLPPGLVEWRARDRHLWEYEAHERDQVIARRRDAYRKVSAWLVSQASVITVSGFDIAATKKRRDNEYEPAANVGRSQAQDAAPGELRAAIIVGAEREGVQIVTVESETPAKGAS